MIFADTSGLYALLDKIDRNHDTANRLWRSFAQRNETILTSSYVLVESHALIQARLGMAALLDFYNRTVPLLSIRWIDKGTHEDALKTLIKLNRRKVSLVDCTSFVLMQQNNVQEAFAFDPHFAEQGFEQASIQE